MYFKTDFSTSISWYINIISVYEITVFKCKFKLNISSLRVKEVPLKRTPGFSQYNTGELSVNTCENKVQGMSYLKNQLKLKKCIVLLVTLKDVTSRKGISSM